MEQPIVILAFVPPKLSEEPGYFAALKIEKGIPPRYTLGEIPEQRLSLSKADQYRGQILALSKDAVLFVYDKRTVSLINSYFGLQLDSKDIVELKELLLIFYPSLSQYAFEDLQAKLDIPRKKYLSPAHHEVRKMLAIITGSWSKGLEWDIGFLSKLEEYSKGLNSELFINSLKKEILKKYPDRPLKTSFYPQETAVNLFADNTPVAEEDLNLPVKWVINCFQEGGLLAQNFSGYESRDMQAKMAETIIKGFTESRNILVEAGTGTGKSLAYLIPALWWARKNRQRVIIATHTITLQEQLFTKDLPLLEDILPFRFEKALLKGKGNYLCLRSFYQDKPDVDTSLWDRISLLGLFSWLRETTTGDFNEVAHIQKLSSSWRKYGADNPNCQPGECQFAAQCYLFKARRKAEEADLIVINHSLLLADLKTNYNILPEYGDLIIDEAHNLYQTALKQLGFELSLDQIGRLIENLIGGKGSLIYIARKNGSFWSSVYSNINWQEFDNYLEKLAEYCVEVTEQASDLFKLAQSFLGSRLNMRIDESKLDERLISTFTVAVENLLQRFAKLIETLTKMNHLLLLENDELDKIKVPLLKSKADLLLITDGLQEILQTQEGKRVTYLEKSNTIYLKNTVIDIQGILREKIFQKNNSTVMTSATLTVAGDFDYFARDIGVEDPITVQLDSPFDYDKQMLFCIVNDLQVQERSEENLAMRTAAFIQQIAEMMGGRSLILFTSHRYLRLVYYQLQQNMPESGIRLLAQGIDGPREALLDEFTKNRKSILLGTSSFWEGIDLPGDGLRCVVLSKLPFWPPDNPILEAKSRLLEIQGKDPFNDLHLPEAIIRFKQGFGRLIRTKEDKGVVILLDDRILRKKYGRFFLKSLPISSYFKGNSENILEQVSYWV